MAEELRAEGRTEEALTLVRDAVRASPEDPDARLLLAEVYLDSGNGSLALKAVEQAVARGLPPTRAVFIEARALFLDGRYSEVIELSRPAELPARERLHLLYLQAEARAAQSGSVDGSDDSVVKAYIELFRQMEKHGASVADPELASTLESARSQRPDIDRAWQHFACGRTPEEVVAWAPLHRPGPRILQVGPGRDLTTPAEAAAVARAGDIVEIDAGTYAGGIALWPQDRLVVRGSGERPVVTAGGKSIQQRDVWLFTGDDIVVENVEISGARSPWENGAGIRHTGSGLLLRNVFLHDNENGLLTGNRYVDTNEILIEYSQFARNGDGKGLAHNIYIGRSKRFELRYSFSHQSRGGHLVKSRARTNIISYNRLTDEEQGSSSYVIDLPEGGNAQIIGNMLEQGAGTLNHGMISFAGEGRQSDVNRLLVVSNSIYNRDFRGIAVRNHAGLDVRLVNNLIGGTTLILHGQGLELEGNLNIPEHGMIAPRDYDYGLAAGARAVDGGIDFGVEPEREYVHPLRWRNRQRVWQVDVGAYERCGLH